MQYDNILIIDDSETSRMIVQRCFQMAGFRTARYYHAENGSTALETLFRHQLIELVVTDLNMPILDGEGFIRTLRQSALYEHLPIIIVSSMDPERLQMELGDLEILAIIQKPISPQKVMAAMDMHHE